MIQLSPAVACAMIGGVVNDVFYVYVCVSGRGEAGGGAWAFDVA